MNTPNGHSIFFVVYVNARVSTNWARNMWDSVDTIFSLLNVCTYIHLIV